MSIIRLNKVIEQTGLSKSSVYAFIKNGTFPPAVQLSVRCVGWKQEDIENWVNNRPSAQAKNEMV